MFHFTTFFFDCTNCNSAFQFQTRSTVHRPPPTTTVRASAVHRRISILLLSVRVSIGIISRTNFRRCYYWLSSSFFLSSFLRTIPILFIIAGAGIVTTSIRLACRDNVTDIGRPTTEGVCAGNDSRLRTRKTGQRQKCHLRKK